MTKVIVQHHVTDYARWQQVFTEHGDVRKRHGATGHIIYRGQDDPNTVIILNDFESAEGAAAFLADSSLKDAMARAGVDGAPQIWVCTEGEQVKY